MPVTRATLPCLVLAMGTARVAEQKARGAGAEVFAGRWDLTINDLNDKPLPSWLELTAEKGAWKGNYVGRWGNARPLPKVVVKSNLIQFVSPKEEEDSKNDLVFDGKLIGETLTGSAQGPNGRTWKWTGKRAPMLKIRPNLQWGEPVALFNGRDFVGWTFDNPT